MKNIVYHGSPNGSIEKFIPNKSTHQKECIYATDNKIVAMLYMAKWTDLDIRLSNVSGKPELVERREGILKTLYNQSGYLYELDGTTFSHYDDLWSLEVISFEKVLTPLNKNYYPNILDAILKEEQKGNIVIFRYPNRPKDVPLDNSDLINKFVEFEKKGLKGAIGHLLKIYPEFTSRVEEKIKEKNEER